MNEQSTGNTGTKDEIYNLVSVLYHSLQSAETIEKYIGDGESEGGDELAQFFQETKEQSTRCADRAKQLLAQRLGQEQSAGANS